MSPSDRNVQGIGLNFVWNFNVALENKMKNDNHGLTVGHSYSDQIYEIDN